MGQTPGTSIIHFPAHRLPYDTETDSLVIDNTGNENWFSYYDQLDFNDNCIGQTVKSIRIYHLLDWISYTGPEYPIPLMDINNDGIFGDAFDAQVFGDTLYLLVDGAQGPALAPKSGFLYYYQVLKWDYLAPPVEYVGKVFDDANGDCSLDGTEPLLANWVVKAVAQPSGYVWIDTTDANGFYEIGICLTDTAAEISLDLPYNYGGNCPMVYQVSMPPAGQTVSQDIPVHLEQSCPILSVDLSSAPIHPCAVGKYAVSYCNLSSIMVPDAKVTVNLDNYFAFTGSTLPATDLGNNAYEFSVGDLDAGRCGEMVLAFTTDCNPEAGATFCSEAHITPIAACDMNGVWSGAWLEASAVCDGDSVHLILTNIGSGNMDQPLDFVVVEDLIMYMQPTPFQLGVGEYVEVTLPANGSTFYIQSPQVEGHPFGGIVAAQIEGCGGLNLPGASLVLPVGSNSPFAAYDCQASDLPMPGNYLSAFPVGYGPQHLIPQNTTLEYTVHFQNVSIDTVQNLSVYVWLPSELDANSIVPGAGSHPYDFDAYPGFVRFRFDQINLPDSATGAGNSQGFISYHISQMPDLPEGSSIEQYAQIQFASQLPVVTNPVQHVIGANFIEIVSDVPDNEMFGLNVFPNPALGPVDFQLPAGHQGGHFVLADGQGRVVRTGEFSGAEYRFEQLDLQQGVYYYTLTDSTGRTYIGKLILHP
ncbi:MAG: T9SS type A sorting domain-containing protein [Saprospiraceae bacterium]